MKKIKVTREWAKDRLACRKSVRRFFERWPNGLTLNRRNLYMAADQLPMSNIMWFASRLSLDEALDHEQWQEVYELSLTSAGRWVISPAKKRAVAKALADALNL
jgi:hypothetical protein